MLIIVANLKHIDYKIHVFSIEFCQRNQNMQYNNYIIKWLNEITRFKFLHDVVSWNTLHAHD